MSYAQRPTELQRALAREDIDDLRFQLQEAFRWHSGDDDPECEHDFFDRDENWLLALTALAMAEYDEPRFLGFIAAGPLEDALVKPYRKNRMSVGEGFLSRVLDEARRTPRFRWMLSGIWTDSAEPHVSEAIRDAVGEVRLDDPLPPRPYA